MKYCHNCGARLEDDMEYCINCGTLQLKLKRTVNVPAPETPSFTPDEPGPVEAPAPVSAPEYDAGFGGSFEAGRPGSMPEVRMPELGIPTFQGRPVQGEAIADGMVPKGTENSFSAGYGRGTEQSKQQIPAFKPDQPYRRPAPGPVQQPAYQAPQTAPANKKKKSGGKTLLIVLLILILLAAIAVISIAAVMIAGSGSGAVPSETGSSDHVIYEDCVVEIGDGYLFKDLTGSDAIAVEVTWTNNSGQTDFPADCIEVRAYQGGETLIITFPSDMDDFSPLADKYYQSVGTGDSVKFVACFELEDRKTPVDIEVINYNDNVKATCTYTLD